MAVRAPFQRDFPALPVDEFRRGASRDHHADGTHRHAGTLRGLRERLDAIFRRSCTGSRNRRRRRSTAPSRQCRATADPRAASDSGIDARSITADTPDTPHSLVRSPARPSDTSIAALAYSRTISASATARLRHAVAADQHLARGRIGCRGMDLAALENGKPERGVADRAGHHHAVAGLCAAAMNHLACWHAPERGDRDHQRARRRNGIAAQQRAIELRGVLAKRRARTASARPRRRRAAPASARSRPAWRPWRRDRKGSPAAPCARRVSGGSSGRKCTPSTMASVVTTMSSPAASDAAASSSRPKAPGSVASGRK